jgi:glutamate N-acetyltransferase / amino-acid N-acetyltransferase
MNPVEGGVTAPKGFRAGGVAAGIKKPGSPKKDCALVVSDTDAAVAGVFTTNAVKSPTVRHNQSVCAGGVARAVFVNSGNANTCVGEAGPRDTAAIAERLAGELGVPKCQVCVCSTGVIGVPLPMDRVEAGVDAVAAALRPDGSRSAAEAIMTTDTVPKERAVEIELSGGVARLGGIAKGSGMIAPNMATMIAVMTTDAAVPQALLAAALRDATAASFNQICVDNDMSTSDTVLLLANGASGASVEPGSPDEDTFREALTALCQDLAKALVKDGEGATKFVEIAVRGARNDQDARTVARAIAHSQLCKTAFYGQDPNWGRITCAAGYSGAEIDPDRLALWFDDLKIVENGCATDFEEARAANVMQRAEFRITVEVGDGPGSAVFWTSDLSLDYVKINADYRT